MTIRRGMRIPQAVNTNSEYAKPLAFLRQQYFRERAPMSRFTYIASLAFSNISDIKHSTMKT